MTIALRQGEGSRTTTRTISSITGGLVVLNGASDANNLDSPLVGDVIELLSTGVNNNDGYYTLTQINTAPAPDTYQIRPAPNNQGAVGSAVRLNRATARTLSATTLTSVTALTGNLALVQVNGANFRTNNVMRNDRLVLSGSSTTANNGGWFIHEVVSDDYVVVRPPDNGAGMTTEAVGTGTIGVRAGVHVALVTAEAALSWQRFLDVGTMLAAPTNSFGSGAPRDFFRRHTIPGRVFWEIVGISRIIIDQSSLGTESTWVSENEFVVANTPNNRGATGDAQVTRLENTGSWGFASSTALRFRLGNQPGNRYSCNAGSAWLNVRNSAGFWGAFGGMSLYGSYFDPRSTGLDLGTGGNVTASIIRGGVRPYNGVIESMIAYNGFGIQGAGAGDQANNLLAQQDSASSVDAPGVTMEGMLISDARVGGILSTAPAGLVIILNPRTEDDLVTAGYGSFGFSPGAIEQHFTFNQRFVYGISPIDSPIVLENLTVRIYEIDKSTGAETLVFSGVTNASGRLNGGLGVQLRRERITSPVIPSIFYEHRLVLEAAGVRLLSKTIVMRQKLTNDFNVELIAPDYEGELDE